MKGITLPEVIWEWTFSVISGQEYGDHFLPVHLNSTEISPSENCKLSMEVYPEVT